MAEDIEVVNIEVSPPRIHEQVLADSGHTIAYYDVAVEVANRSNSHTYHVIADLRHLRYEPKTKIIYLGLDEEGTLEVPGYSPYVVVEPPDLVEVPPGEHVTLKVQVPAILKRIVGSSGGLGLATEVTDMTQAMQVTARVGYAERAFEPDASESSEAMLRRHASWGKTAQRSQRVTLVPPAKSSRELPAKPENHTTRR